MFTQMQRHTPSLESVWAEWDRRERVRKLRADRAARGLPEHPPTPPNSEPWLDHDPRTIEDALYISNCARESILKWFGPHHPSLKS
jgi:hypothetical protein